MKVIDLLNKIASGEKVPKEIKINDDILIWNNIKKDYCGDGAYELVFNDEVIVI